MARSPSRSFIASGVSKAGQITPLVIILSFVLLTEVVVMTGVLGTRDKPQLMLTAFCVLFPVLVAIPFFTLLAIKPWVFYAPKDFGIEVDPTSYISAMSSRTYVLANESTNKFISDLPTLIEGAISKRVDLLRQGLDAEQPQALKDIGRQIFADISASELVKVDCSVFRGGVVQFPISDTTIASQFLDSVYFTIRENYPLPVYTYDDKWLLVESETGKQFREMGRLWAFKHGLDEDDRTLSSVGIKPGMSLKAIMI